MPSCKHKEYDDDLLVHLIARGDMTHKAIARRVGLCRASISMIAGGTRRHDLQPRLRATIEEYHKRAMKLGAGSMARVVAKHIKDGLDPKADPDHARRCREYAMNKFLDPPASAPPAHQPLPTPGLTSEDYQDLAKFKGEPRDDPV